MLCPRCGLDTPLCGPVSDLDTGAVTVECSVCGYGTDQYEDDLYTVLVRAPKEPKSDA